MESLKKNYVTRINISSEYCFEFIRSFDNVEEQNHLQKDDRTVCIKDSF